MALRLGAQAVTEVLAVRTQDSQLAEQLRGEEKRHRKIQQEVQDLRAELERERESAERRIELERSKIIDEARREAIYANRESLLMERERHAAERAAVIAKLEERHTAVEAHLRGETREAKVAFERLQTEHEGLVMKLITRLETRSGMNAPTLGRTFEENVARHLRQTFGARHGFALEDVHSTGHSGDLIMTFDGLRILIELKSYDPKTRIPTKEVEKFARDLAEVQPPCDAGIMISACSEITGHYSCGALEVSATVACVPTLFVNNFLSIGEPQVTLHMTRVFLAMVQLVANNTKKLEATESEGEEDRLRRANEECIRRCSGYLLDINRESTDLLRQVTTMKTAALRLRESVIALVESEVARFRGIIQLLSGPVQEEVLPILDRTVFTDPSTMSEPHRELAVKITGAYAVGNLQHRCATKDLLTFAQSTLNTASEKVARDALKAIFIESVVKHGHILGIGKL